MELKLSIPDGQQNPSIEVFKLALRRLENDIVDLSIENHASDSPVHLNSLCNYCAVVGERIRAACSGDDDAAQEVAFGGGARDASGNLHLGSLREVFAQESCSLCCLIKRQFLRMKWREIYSNARLKKVELHGLILGELLELAYPEEEVSAEKENQWIIDPFSQRLQISLNTIPSDGRLLLWLPENTVDEVNDEPAQLPMIAADHEALFPGVKPWIPLPCGISNDKRDLLMFSNCFKSCIQNHGECREISVNLGLGVGPSRLIDIEEMRIVKMGIDETPRYFVLSYVWGHPPFLLLKKENEREFSTLGFLGRQVIPRTILDAMEVTRRFGSRYLWVDALCIVQDDLENKMHEIDRMHIIYAQAEMAIVAATGNGANSGLINIDPVFADERTHLINGSRFTVDPMEMRQEVEFSTWFSRGWTFQELVFSKRILYFTPGRTYYACEEGSWSEDFPFVGEVDEQEDEDEEENQNQKRNVFYDENLKTGFDFREKINPFENFTSMVSKMSTRQFTLESDCLNACRGFYTGLLLKGLGGSVCGLPGFCFEFALAWQADGNLSRRGKSSELKDFGFPSWSWAAWNGPIEYPFLCGPDKCAVISEVRWAVFEAYKVVDYAVDDTCDDEEGLREYRYRFRQVVPTIKVHTLPEQSYQSMSSWLSHSYIPEKKQDLNSHIGSLVDLESERSMSMSMSTRKLISRNFIGPSILIFHTKSLICYLKEASKPSLAKHKDLRFLSIYSLSSSSSSSSSSSPSEKIIGELKIDITTLNTFLNNSQIPITSDDIHIRAEIISLFEMDFATSSVRDLLWINRYSARNTFSEGFREVLEERCERRGERGRRDEDEGRYVD
ncbi:b40313cc-a92d-46a1-b393-c61df653b66d-CDS [Sclerotinia trifoliorum]|uniref:B40313cc-a92d-46a1-b393-c61df653b66d-CDS n=1 Tax=Sclerotinia trifoliorum TaxID=28548 RepID=A0A8H2VWG7_9HELO|nr:b40313cc-a92d-46a1-b393-c61df653b66d-CDS [Sclerotinia trifoliorum]